MAEATIIDGKAIAAGLQERVAATAAKLRAEYGIAPAPLLASPLSSIACRPMPGCRRSSILWHGSMPMSGSTAFSCSCLCRPALIQSA
jgi:hypothetical protein